MKPQTGNTFCPWRLREALSLPSAPWLGFRPSAASLHCGYTASTTSWCEHLNLRRASRRSVAWLAATAAHTAMVGSPLPPVGFIVSAHTAAAVSDTTFFFKKNQDELSLQAHSSAEAFVSARLYLICKLNVIKSCLNRRLTTLGLSLITPPPPSQWIRAPTTQTTTRVYGTAQATSRMSCPSDAAIPFTS